MNIEDLLVYAIPVVVFLVALFPTYWLAKGKNAAGLICMGVIWAGFTGAMFFGIENATGWDGLGFMLALIGISAPVGAAGLIGGTAGWFKSEKATHA